MWGIEGAIYPLICEVDRKRSTKASENKKARTIIHHKREIKEEKEKKETIGTAHNMVSREQKRATLHEKLQLIRSITNSHALNETSIIIDASKYIKDLKQKVERLNQDMAAAQSSSDDDQNQLPMVTVETLEKGFLINVFSSKSCPGLLVSILEAFEEMGLNVMEARVSCTDTFRFQAVGGETEEHGEGIDAQTVKLAVGQAIRNWSQQTSTDQQ